jgi:hypothetical protein
MNQAVIAQPPDRAWTLLIIRSARGVSAFNQPFVARRFFQ